MISIPVFSILFMAQKFTLNGLDFFRKHDSGAINLDKENKIKNAWTWKWWDHEENIGASLGKQVFSQKISESF